MPTLTFSVNFLFLLFSSLFSLLYPILSERKTKEGLFLPRSSRGGIAGYRWRMAIVGIPT